MQKGFTLIELLVVVLIIGILASIALPQYKKVVLKTRYSTMKFLTKSMYEAEKRYYLLHNKYTNNFEDLDIDMPKHNRKEGISFYYDNYRCILYKETEDSNFQIACTLKDKKKEVISFHYGIYKGSKDRHRCIAHSLDTNDIYNQICKEDTRGSGSCVVSAGTCLYEYH